MGIYSLVLCLEQNFILSWIFFIMVQLVLKGCHDDHPCKALVKSIQYFMAKQRTIKVFYCCKEANFVDCLASMSHLWTLWIR